MSGVHQLEFEKRRPSLVHLDAPAAFRRDRIVVSYDWANDREYLVMKLAFIDGTTDTLVLRRHVAERMQQQIVRLDRRNWTPSSSSSEAQAPGQKPAAKPAPQRKAAAASAHRPAAKSSVKPVRPTHPRNGAKPARPAKAAKAKGRR